MWNQIIPQTEIPGSLGILIRNALETGTYQGWIVRRPVRIRPKLPNEQRLGRDRPPLLKERTKRRAAIDVEGPDINARCDLGELSTDVGEPTA
jgi:hypothetical protein